MGTRSQRHGLPPLSSDAGDPVVGVVVLDRLGRVVDADPGVRDFLAGAPGLERALAHAARSQAHRSGWSEHNVRLPDHTLRIRMLVDSGPGDVIAFVAEEERPLVLDLATLSPREREVALMVGSKVRDAQIARRLKIAVATVRWHLTNIYRKTGVRHRDALLRAVVLAQSGVSPPPRARSRGLVAARR